jgi:hypothetical protein
MIGGQASRSERAMKRIEVWRWLIGIFAVFWIIFAGFLFTAGIPFIIVSMALTVVLAMSAVVVGLAWAYQHNR